MKINFKDLVKKLNSVVIAYSKVTEDEQFTKKNQLLSEKLYSLTDKFFSIKDDEGYKQIESLLASYIKLKDIDSFDVLNSTIIELISFDHNEKDFTPYSLLWVGITSFSESIDLDGYDTVIKNSLFESGLTSSIDDTAVLLNAFPINFSEQLSLKDIYNLTSQYVENPDKYVFDKAFNTDEMDNKNVKNFYLPIFVKSPFGEIVENLNNNEDLFEVLNKNSKLILNKQNVIFLPPVTFNEANEQNNFELFNSTKLNDFFEFILSEENKSTEMCILSIDNVSDSYVIFYLDKDECCIKGSITIEEKYDYIGMLENIVNFAIDNEFNLLQSENSISTSLLNEIMLNSIGKIPKISDKCEKELSDLFKDTFDTELKEVYHIITGGGSKTIQ